MTTKRPLRAVDADETAPSKPKLTITQAADAGNQRELLAAMRSRIAQTIEDPRCPPRDLAALSRRLQDINREIEAIDAKVEQEAREDAETADAPFDASAV